MRPKILELDTRSIAIRHELEHKRRGFSLLAELSVSLRQGTATEDIFMLATQRINAALNMQKTAVLLLNKEGQFVSHVLQGYSPDEKDALAGQPIVMDTEFFVRRRLYSSRQRTIQDVFPFFVTL